MGRPLSLAVAPLCLDIPRILWLAVFTEPRKLLQAATPFPKVNGFFCALFWAIIESIAGCGRYVQAKAKDGQPFL